MYLLEIDPTHINLSKCASVNGQKIRKVDKVKFLVVFIDDQLSWDYQIEHIENKLLSSVNYCTHKTY